MKAILVLLLVSVGCAWGMAIPAPPPAVGYTQRLFMDFKTTYGRRYATPKHEEAAFDCFAETLATIAKNEAKEPYAKFGVNQFADICAADFAKHYLGYRPANGTRKSNADMAKPIATEGACNSIDWRTAGLVSPVRNQGQCGSCWAFAASGNMEGQWAKSKGKLISLSNGELTECTSSTGDDGCCGGLMDDAWAWVVQNGGIDSEANYPYTSGNGVVAPCQTNLVKNKVATFTSYQDLPKDEKQMAAWVCENGPLSVGVYADAWQTYTSGVLTNCGSDLMDHAGLIVGFDASANPPYWTVKNSWGPTWGEKGYIRIEMFQNECGIDQQAGSAIV